MMDGSRRSGLLAWDKPHRDWSKFFTCQRIDRHAVGGCSYATFVLEERAWTQIVEDVSIAKICRTKLLEEDERPVGEHSYLIGHERGFLDLYPCVSCGKVMHIEEMIIPSLGSDDLVCSEACAEHWTFGCNLD